MSDDLDFSPGKPAGAPKPAATPPTGPIYIPAVARAFFESAGKEEIVPQGTVFFSENEKASRLLLKRDKMYYLVSASRRSARSSARWPRSATRRAALPRWRKASAT